MNYCLPKSSLNGFGIHTPKFSNLHDSWARNDHAALAPSVRQGPPLSGITRKVLPVNADLAPYLAWAHQAIDVELNGLLVNWFDGKLGHYIGKHRDSEIGIQEGSSYVTISLGEPRILRLRKWKGGDRLDIPVENGSIAIIPYATNRAWTHEIPKSKRALGHRISVTMRAFNRNP